MKLCFWNLKVKIWQSYFFTSFELQVLMLHWCKLDFRLCSNLSDSVTRPRETCLLMRLVSKCLTKHFNMCVWTWMCCSTWKDMWLYLNVAKKLWILQSTEVFQIYACFWPEEIVNIFRALFAQGTLLFPISSKLGKQRLISL